MARIYDLAPAEIAKLVRDYLTKSSPKTRETVIPLIKKEIERYDNESL